MISNPYSNNCWRDKNWPKGLRRRLQFEMGGRPLFEYLEGHARKTPQKPALIFSGKEISYQELNEMSDSVAQFLIAHGIKKGEPVGLFLPTFPGFAVVYMGVLKAGGAVTACSPAFKEWELEYQLRDTGTRILFCLDQYMDVVRPVWESLKLQQLVVTGYADFLDSSFGEVIPENIAQKRSFFSGTIELVDIFKRYRPVPPNVAINLHQDVALIQYTGGTTGSPKGAIHTFYTQLYKTACHAQTSFHGLYQGGGNHYILQMAPIYHIMGILQFCTYLYKGFTQVMIPHFDPIEAMKAIQQYKPEMLFSVTPMNVAMMNHSDIGKYNLRSIKRNRVSSLGIKLTEEIAERWKHHIADGADVVESSYGLTETHTGDTFMPLDKPPKWGSNGIPNYGEEFKIVSFEDRNRMVPLGDMGEIALLSPSNFKGYWQKPKETLQTLIDGWVYTGDMGRFDEDGYLYFLGRKKEMIKVSGYSVFPEEVETFLNLHPAIDISGVIGVADEKKGEVIKAVVVLKEAFKGKVNPEEIIEWAKEKMSYYKVPKIIEIRNHLPKHGGTGKILRRLL
jgi:long-chain acyl-CoA synthetase